MKVLMICTEKLPVPPVLGGAIQTYISGILPYLSKTHDITVLGISEDSLPDKETIDGIHFVRIPGNIFEIYREGVISYVESNQFDLIHIFNRPRLVIPIRKVAPKSKITLSMHNDMFKLDKIGHTDATAVIEEVSNIVTISDYVGKEIMNQYPQAAPKIRTIYSGVDIERFLPGNHQKMKKIRKEIRKAHGLDGKTVILFTGRLSNNKGVDRLVRALPELSNKFKDLALVIVGSKWFSQDDVTDYVAYVRALAKKSPVPVVTTGFVSPSEIQNWYAASDLFVCTSQWQEPLARVHYEAMAAGLPIITTARGGNREIILLNENGLVVENPEDPNDFAEKITEVLSNSSLMKKMGEKGRKLVESRYTWDRVATEVLQVWEQSIQTSLTNETQDESANRITEVEKERDKKKDREKYSERDSRRSRKRSSSRYKKRDRRSDSRRDRKRSSSRYKKRDRRSDSRRDRKRSSYRDRNHDSRQERKKYSYRDKKRDHKREDERRRSTSKQRHTGRKERTERKLETVVKTIDYRWKKM